MIHQVYQTQLREHMLDCSVELRNSSCILEALPGKLDINKTPT